MAWRGDPFYSDPKWRTFRADFLRRHPTCQDCGKPSKHVDHIVSRRRGGAPYAESNCAALCHSCHSRKTALKDGGFGHAPRDNTPACDHTGVPTAADHPWNR